MLKVLKELIGSPNVKVVDSVSKQAKFNGRVVPVSEVVGQVVYIIPSFLAIFLSSSFPKNSPKVDALSCILSSMLFVFWLSGYVLRTNLKTFEWFLRHRTLLIFWNTVLTAINCPIVGVILLSGHHGFDVPIFGGFIIFCDVYAIVSLVFISLLFITRDITVGSHLTDTKA